MEKINKKDKFISKAIKIHGNIFDYDSINYINSKTRINIRCKAHDKLFEQTPAEHLRGKIGCKECSGRINNTHDFMYKAKEKHLDKYEYSKSEYVASNIKITITCPKHGDFEQLPINHIKGQGCPKCSRINSNSYDTKVNFIDKAKIAHGDKYSYDLVNYIDSKTHVIISCPRHGDFKQLPYSHLRGKGCVLCASEVKKNLFSSTKEEFVDKAKIAHNDKYDYSEVNYVNSQTKVKILCPKHGVFEQLPYDHISKHGCVKCTSSISSHEKEIEEFLISNGVEVITSSRSIIPPYQIDLYIPTHNLAIEFDGLYWHSEEYLDKDYHLDKTEACQKQRIKLIHIFEDEWLFKKDVVKSRLKNILGLTTEKIYGRKTKVREVSSLDSNVFLDENHLQGHVNSSIRLGLYNDNELVSLMTFNKPRLGVGIIYDGYELSRFCNKLNTSVIGGADKLLKHFIKTYNPKEIISYADKRWSQGGLYEKLGFKQTHINKPNYWYIIGKNRKHRFGFRKEILKKQGFDTDNQTEHQIMLDRKIYRIYDCGTITFSIKITNSEI